MKIKVKSYELKGLGHKNKSKSKANNSKLNSKLKNNAGIKDNRKYVHDTTLSEAEKIARRMALENMKRKTNLKNSSNSKIYFSKNDEDNDAWEDDPFLLKAKKIGKFDEGLDESSAEEEDEEHKQKQTEKYFAKGSKKKTLEEIIRDSKIEKYERSKINEKDGETTIQLNEMFRDKIRFMLPKSGAIAKLKSTTDRFQDDKTNYGEIFQEHFGKLIYSQRPMKADGKSIKPVANKEKENEKLVKMKIKRLRDHLVKEGIANEDYNEDDECLSNDDDEDDEDSNEVDENESDLIESEEENDKKLEISEESEESELDESSAEEEDEEMEEEEEDDDSDIEEEEKSDEESESVDKVPVNEKDAIDNLKKLIVNFSKKSSTKRKLECEASDDNDETMQPIVKKCRNENSDSFVDDQKNMINNNNVGHNKTELDCLRILLKMPDLRKDALLVLAQEMSTTNCEEHMFSKKLIFATLFENTLRSQCVPTNCFSPELVGMLRFLMENATKDSCSWLFLNSKMVDLENSKLVNVTQIADEKIDIGRRIISFIYHISTLIQSIIDFQSANLVGRRALFEPFDNMIKRLPTEFYPSWLNDRLTKLCDTIKKIKQEPVPVLRMKKVFKIIQLLEPELETKFDPRKDLIQSLKDKVKKEKRVTKRELRGLNLERVRADMQETKKQSTIRKKKTMEIINHMTQIS